MTRTFTTIFDDAESKLVDAVNALDELNSEIDAAKGWRDEVDAILGKILQLKDRAIRDLIEDRR